MMLSLAWNYGNKRYEVITKNEVDLYSVFLVEMSIFEVKCRLITDIFLQYALSCYTACHLLDSVTKISSCDKLHQRDAGGLQHLCVGLSAY